jgi:hypothetical protein
MREKKEISQNVPSFEAVFALEGHGTWTGEDIHIEKLHHS